MFPVWVTETAESETVVKGVLHFDNGRKWPAAVGRAEGHSTAHYSQPPLVPWCTDQAGPFAAEWPPLSFSTCATYGKLGDSSHTITEFMKGWKMIYTKSRDCKCLKSTLWQKERPSKNPNMHSFYTEDKRWLYQTTGHCYEPDIRVLDYT